MINPLMLKYSFLIFYFVCKGQIIGDKCTYIYTHIYLHIYVVCMYVPEQKSYFAIIFNIRLNRVQ